MSSRFVMGPIEHIDPSRLRLIEQYENLRADRRPADLYDEHVHRWHLTERLSSKDEAAGYVLKTLEWMREISPEEAALNSDKVEPALRDELVKWTPKFAQLWEGRAHFIVSTVTDHEHERDEYSSHKTRIFSLVTHSGGPEVRSSGSIFTESQREIDEGAIAILASTGAKGKELSDDIRRAIKRRDDICVRYFSKRGIQEDKRHLAWEVVTDIATIRNILSEQRATHLPSRENIPEFVAKTGIQEEEFKPFVYDIWQSENDFMWNHPTLQVPRWAKWLMVALWYDVVAPRLERERTKHPAVPLVVHVEAMNMLTRARLAENNKGQRGIGFPGDDIAHVDFSLIETALRGRVESGFKLFGSTTSHRVFRHLVLSGHRQALQGDGDPRVLNFTGAYAKIAEDLRLKSKVESEKIRDIIEAMNHHELNIGNRREPVLMRTYTKGAGPKPAKLEIILGFPLLPNYVQDLKDAFENRLAERIAKRLCPLVSDPPLIGRERDHGAQYTFQMALVSKMRLESESIVRLGGVTLDNATLEQLAILAGLPLTLVDPLMDRWTQDGNDAPKVLERVDGNVYKLAEVPVWEMMVSGATKETQGRNWAKKGLAKKNEKIAKRGKAKRGE